MSAGYRLRIAVITDGRKQFQIARAADIRDARFSAIARGRVEAKPDERARIAAALGVPEAGIWPDREDARSLPSERREVAATPAA